MKRERTRGGQHNFGFQLIKSALLWGGSQGWGVWGWGRAGGVGVMGGGGIVWGEYIFRTGRKLFLR